MDESEQREGVIAYLTRLVSEMIHAAGRLVSDQFGALLREPALFLGAILLILGLMSFEVGRYCDGNTAQYLSCTRSAAYYYYDTLDRTIAVIGAFFLLGWYVRR